MSMKLESEIKLVGPAPRALEGWRIGYARISTADQELRLQEDALQAAGCQKIYKDVASGKSPERPAVDGALRFLREGDTVVVDKVDRLGRSLKHPIETLLKLEEPKTQFRSLSESIDTSTAA